MVAAVMQRWGRIDILVNNAGITSAKRIFDMTDEEFDAVLGVNLGGAFKCTREVAPIMRDQGGGSIVNTSSMVGTYGGKMQTAYSCLLYTSCNCFDYICYCYYINYR